MAYTKPSVADFKAYFNRDFPYGATLADVQDTDITKALFDAGFSFNSALFSAQDQYTLGYLLLSAHYLVLNLRASSQGIQGQYSWLVTSKSVGSVSEGLAIPEKIMANPYFAMLSKTPYGAKYLELILPRLIGPMFSSFGRTHA